MTRPEISRISPFFIVSNAPSALSFYRDRLGFEITFQEPADDPFFGIVRRGGAMIMLRPNLHRAAQVLTHGLKKRLQRTPVSGLYC